MVSVVDLLDDHGISDGLHLLLDIASVLEHTTLDLPEAVNG